MKKLILLILIILALPLVFQSVPTEILKLKTFDALVKEQEPSGNFVILNITEEDVRKRGGFPFPRRDLAQIQIDLINEGAIGIGWALSFSEADRFGGDDAFAQTLGYLPSVLAMFETPNGQYPKTVGTVIKGDEVGGIPTAGVVENIDVLKQKSFQGIATAPVDVDNLVRRIPLLMKTPDGWTPSFGTEILKALTGTRSYIITTNANGIQEIAVRHLPPVKTDNFGRKWISWVNTPTTTLDEMNVAGKFVIIGVTANGVMPQVATPVGLLEPHKIQAALAESILIQDSPMIPEWSIAAEMLIFITSVTLIWLVIAYFGITLGVALALAIMLSTALGGYYAIQAGILIDVTWSLVSQFITGSIGFYLRFREQYKLRQQIKKQFEHYLDPRQVKQLQKNPELLKLGGEKRRCTFMFTDLRGFTALSESVEPEKVTYIMNRVLTAQVEAVQKYNGCIDKFIGDAGMYIWNAPLDVKHHEQIAYECALEIIENVKKVSDELVAEGLPPVAIGLGLNTGDAIVGNMGSDTRFDYSAIGDAVNTAARLESATKERNVDILIGEETEKFCGYKLKVLESIKVKGKAKPLKIYTKHL
jgi:adenylate cyclase